MCLVFVGFYNCFYNCFYNSYTVLMSALLVANWPFCIQVLFISTNYHRHIYTLFRREGKRPRISDVFHNKFLYKIMSCIYIMQNANMLAIICGEM